MSADTRSAVRPYSASRIVVVMVAAAGFGLVYSLVHLLPVGIQLRAAIESALYLVPVGAAVVASGVAAYRVRGRLKLEWVLLFLAVSVFAIEEVYWSIYASYVDPAGPPLQSVILDVPLLAYLLLIPVVLSSVEPRRTSRLQWAGDTIDFGLLVMLCMLVAQVLIVKPSHTTLFLHDTTEFSEVVAIVADLAFCAYLLGYKRPRGVEPRIVIGIAFGIWALADAAYFATLSSGSYVSGGPVAYGLDLFWMTGWALIAITAWLRIRSPLTSALDDESARPEVSWLSLAVVPAVLLLSLPYLVFFASSGSMDSTDYMVLLAIGIATAVLVSARSGVMFLENRALTLALSERADRDRDRAIASETRFRTIFDTTPLGLAQADFATGRLVECNPAFRRIIGRSADELAGLALTDFSSPGDAGSVFEVFNKLGSGEAETWNTEQRFVRPDGIEMWAAVTVAPMRAVDGAPTSLVVILEDITERKGNEQAKIRRIEIDDMVAGVLARLAGSSAEGTDATIDHALEEFGRFLGVDNAYVLLFQVDGQYWTVAHAWHQPDVRPDINRATLVPADETPWMVQALKEGRVVRAASLDDMPPQAAKDARFMHALGVESVLQIPLRGDGGTIKGSIGLGMRHSGREWTDDDIRLTGLLGSAIANSLERQRAQHEGTLSQMSTIFALAKLAESRDDATGKHIERVQRLCEVLVDTLIANPAFASTVDQRFATLLSNAAPLHDVGKVGIPDAVLLKPGPLTAEEFEVVKRHTVIGAETLAAVSKNHPSNEFIRMGMDIARSHHERWDGTGYPDGLAGNQIPLSARVMSVADVYEALRSPRSYKPAMPHDEAVRIIVDGAGKAFDPAIVKAFERAGARLEEAWRQTQ